MKNKPAKRPSLEIYKAKDGHRWRLRAANGKIIAESGEAFRKHPKAETITTKIVSAMAIANWRDEA